MAHALYRKYRSKNLSEIVGQPHITTTLGNALKSGSLSHAYLFTGPRGVGKTSIARILAHEVNGFDYDESATRLDIIEIDAASNRRIDEIRQLRDKVHSAPTEGKYKVYIIDEVHMLTREAFNALLKTLEEPPAHVIFILATTEAHKLPETIISRTQRFTFKPVAKPEVCQHLNYIAKQESIKIDQQAIELIADHGGGSFRDSISLLDQISGLHDQKITADDVRTSLGIPPESALNQLIEVLSTSSTSELLSQLQTLKNQGYQAPQIAAQLMAYYRQSLTSSSPAPNPGQSLHAIRLLLSVSVSHDPFTSLEIALLELQLNYGQSDQTTSSPPPQAVKTTAPLNIASSPATAAKTISQPAPKPKPAPKNKTNPTEKAPAQTKSPSQNTNSASSASADSKPSAFSSDIWQEALSRIKQNHNTLHGLARMAEVEASGNQITLSVAFDFHRKRLSDSRNKAIIAQTLQEIAGNSFEITCQVKKDAQPTAASSGLTPKSTQSTAPSSDIETISNIFGGAEVLES